MPDSVRRSGRTRKVNKRYTNEGWDERTLELLRESDSSGPDHETPSDLAAVQGNGDDEFDVAQTVIDEQEDENASLNSLSQHSSASSSPRRQSAATTTTLKDVATPITPRRRAKAVSIETPTATTTPRTAAYRTRTVKPESTIHTRGVAEVRWKFGRASQYSAVFGPEMDDFQGVLHARDLWALHGRDAVLPSYSTMSQILTDRTDERFRTDSIEGRAPAQETDAPKATLGELQNLKITTTTTLETEGYLAPELRHRFVLGPEGKEQSFEVPVRQPLQIGRAWPRPSNQAVPSSNDWIDPVIGTENTTSMPETPTARPISLAYHEGWLLNVGSGVRHLAWAPALDKEHQHLAIVCRSTAAQRSRAHLVEPERAPAFSRSASYPANVQIWTFAGKIDETTQLFKLSTSKIPRLAQVMACDCGDIREIRWLPNHCEGLLEDNVGALVMLSTDGFIRLIYVPKISLNDTIPVCSKIIKPRLTIESPQNVVFTTFTCPSSTDLVVGASDGTVRLYNLEHVTEAMDLQPYTILDLHSSYVLSLAMTHMDDAPPFLVSASTAGDLLLTDLRSPTQDRVSVSKARLPTKNLVYSSHARSWVTTVDSSGRTDASSVAETRVIAHPMRHFFVAHQLSRLPQGTGSSTTLAGSKVHPFILTGSTTGTVVCQNVLRRLVPSSRAARFKPWTQKICEYQWMPQQPKLRNAQSVKTVHDQQIDPLLQGPEETFNIIFHGHDTRPGISRFHEGFKPEFFDSTGLRASPKSSSNAKRKRSTARSVEPDFVVADEADEDDEVVEDVPEDRPAFNKPLTNQDLGAEAVFEEEQAVTAIAWNENPECGTWAAMGWGSGIVRVQDLGHDVDSSVGTMDKTKAHEEI